MYWGGGSPALPAGMTAGADFEERRVAPHSFLVPAKLDPPRFRLYASFTYEVIVLIEGPANVSGMTSPL